MAGEHEVNPLVNLAPVWDSEPGQAFAVSKLLTPTPPVEEESDEAVIQQYNTAVGYNAGVSATSGEQNTAIGYGAVTSSGHAYGVCNVYDIGASRASCPRAVFYASYTDASGYERAGVESDESTVLRFTNSDEPTKIDE